jgi:hypothetical protein
MSDSGRPTKVPRKSTRKPPPRWRKYLVQAELELPPPAMSAPGRTLLEAEERVEDDGISSVPLAWWQMRPVAIAVALLLGLLLIVTIAALRGAARDRAAAEAARADVETLTLRAIDSEQPLHIAPNPRSWSAAPDATIDWPEPPQLLQLYMPVGYADFQTFGLVMDKVDHGRVLVLERLTPDSNRELRLALNSSAFGPGEYRLRVQGYTWRGQRVDVGWVRLLVNPRR